MKSAEWITAIRNGAVTHELNPITVKANGHTGVFMVSADAVRIDRVRHTCSAYAAQQAADALGCLLLTSKLYEERWKQATVKIKPALCDVRRATAHDHSEKVWKEIMLTSRVSPGPWIVADVGKAWIIDAKCSVEHAVNHGWIVNRAEVNWDSSGRAFWMGVPVTPTTGIEDEFMIQNRGAAHTIHHEDYSQVLLLVDDECVVDGVKMCTTDVYQDPELCCLVTHNQLPLSFSRQPGVPVVGAVYPYDDEMPTTPPAARISTEPGMTLPWLDADYTLGERAVAFAKSEMSKGVKEDPPRSNNSSRIAEYLEPCVRDGKGQIGKYLAKTGANWCAAFFWFCQKEATLIGEESYPYRCSGLESENDAMARGAWRRTELVLDGEWEPEEGDGVILKRGTQAWQRHMCRYVRRLDQEHFETIGGNEGNTIKLTKRRFDDPQLHGFIELPRDVDSDLIYEAVPDQLYLTALVDDQNDGEKAA